MELSQPIFGKGYPIFNGQGELSGITVVGVEREKRAAIVVSARKILSLIRVDESAVTQAEWTENKEFSWRESPTGTYLNGLANYMTGHYYQARPLLENAVANDKGLSEDTFYYLGNCYESEDLHGLAIKAYTNALKFNPASARVYENLAWSSMKAGKPGDALEACYNAVINERGCKSRVYLLMARIRNSIGDFRAAVTAAHGALNYDPDSACAFNELGAAYNGLGMYEEAVQALFNATSLDLQYGEAFNNLGQAYLRSGRVFNAIVVFKHAAAIQSEYSPALKNLGEAYSTAGLHQKALEAYRTAIGVCPDDPFTFNRLASEYVKAGDFQEAARIYQSAIKALPESAWLHYKLGRIYCRTGRMAAAKSEHYLLNQLNPRLAGQLLIWIERESNS
jgi:tetratricopeptide (TPR) repeat protein